MKFLNEKVDFIKMAVQWLTGDNPRRKLFQKVLILLYNVFGHLHYHLQYFSSNPNRNFAMYLLQLESYNLLYQQTTS